MPEPLAPRLWVDEGQTPRNDPLYVPHRYLASIRAVFRRIIDNPVGQQVVASLRRDVIIVPLQNANERNAFAGTRSRTWDAERAATPRGEPVRYCSDSRRTPVDETGRTVPGVGPGTGAGTTARVQFSPWMFAGPDPWAPTPGAGDEYAPWADEVLVHELVHAAQITRGLCSCVPVGHGYDTFSEFCAVTVQSMYASCRPDGHVRTNHRGHIARSPRSSGDVLPPTLLEHDESVMLSRFRRDMEDLCGALEGVPNPPMRYNPFLEQRRVEAQALQG